MRRATARVGMEPPHPVPLARKVTEHAPLARPPEHERAQNQCALVTFGDYKRHRPALAELRASRR